MIEAPVYEKYARRVGSIMVAVLFLPIILAIFAIRSAAPRDSEVLLIVAGFLMVVFVILLLVLHLSTNVWIRIDRTNGRVSHLYRFFGWSVREKAYELAQFNRISLFRRFRGGYVATLVGRQQEVIIAGSWKLGNIRTAAERAAAASGLPINDQL